MSGRPATPGGDAGPAGGGAEPAMHADKATRRTDDSRSIDMVPASVHLDGPGGMGEGGARRLRGRGAQVPTLHARVVDEAVAVVVDAVAAELGCARMDGAVAVIAVVAPGGAVTVGVGDVPGAVLAAE